MFFYLFSGLSKVMDTSKTLYINVNQSFLMQHKKCTIVGTGNVKKLTTFYFIKVRLFFDISTKLETKKERQSNYIFFVKKIKRCLK